jgi:hypothetical protein
MTSLPDVNLIIIFIEKDRPSYTLHKISEDMKKLEDIYIAAIEKKWIQSKQMFFFMNKGQLLQGDIDISTLKSDIMLIICSKLNDFRLSSYVNNNSLMQDLSNIIMRPSMSSGGITPYLNTNVTNLSNNSATSTSIPVVPFNTTNESLAPAFSQLSETSLGNENSAGSQLMQEFQSSINNMLNSLNTSVLDPVVSTVSSAPNSNTTTPISINNTTIISPIPLNSTSVSMETINLDQHFEDVIETETTNSSQVEGLVDSEIELNENGTNVDSVTNTLTQLLNIYQSTSSTSNFDNIRGLYETELNEMLAMGFTDENRILMSLYVCEGNCENAINYYLSLQGD